jgi:hypothetical protein
MNDKKDSKIKNIEYLLRKNDELEKKLKIITKVNLNLHKALFGKIDYGWCASHKKRKRRTKCI